MADILWQVEAGIGKLTLNRVARKNAVSQAMWLEISRLVTETNNDPSVRVVILCSASNEIFSAGADLDEFEQTAQDATFREENRKSISDACQAIRLCHKPTIAVLQGAAIGGGAALAFACDMRFGDYTASFLLPPAKLGLIYPLQETARIIDLVGPSVARDMLFTGRPIKSDEAQHNGLINHLFATEKLWPQVLSEAQKIAQNSGDSIAAMKEVIRRVLAGQRLEDEESAALFHAAYASDDFQEGIRAFRERRAPNFKKT